MTYLCNDCGAQFDELDEGVCPECGSENITMEDAEEVTSLDEVVAEADDKNKKGRNRLLRFLPFLFVQRIIYHRRLLVFLLHTAFSAAHSSALYAFGPPCNAQSR